MIDQRDLEDHLTEAFAWSADHTVIEPVRRPHDLPCAVDVDVRSPVRGLVVTAAAVLLTVVALCSGRDS